jgi:hypothetical protein
MSVWASSRTQHHPVYVESPVIWYGVAAFLPSRIIFMTSSPSRIRRVDYDESEAHYLSSRLLSCWNRVAVNFCRFQSKFYTYHILQLEAIVQANNLTHRRRNPITLV